MSREDEKLTQVSKKPAQDREPAHRPGKQEQAGDKRKTLDELKERERKPK